MVYTQLCVTSLIPSSMVYTQLCVTSLIPQYLNGLHSTLSTPLIPSSVVYTQLSVYTTYSELSGLHSALCLHHLFLAQWSTLSSLSTPLIPSSVVYTQLCLHH